MSRQLTSADIEPMRLSQGELKAIMDMAEASIVSAEAADKLYGLNELVQTRAAASLIQAKCEREIMRQNLMQREQDQKRAEELGKTKEPVPAGK